MNIMSRVMLAMISMYCICSCSSTASSKGYDICFTQFKPQIETSSLAPGEGPFSKNMVGDKVTLSGTLQDTSAINLFRTHAYNGFRVSQRRLYVKNPVLQKTGPDFWKPVFCLVEARITKVDEVSQDHNEIEVLSHKEIDMKPVLNGLKKAAKWVKENRTTIDINKIKEKPVKNKLIAEAIRDADLNKKPYQEINEIKGVDIKRGIAEFLCGRYVLTETPQLRGDFVDILIVYDLNKQKIVRVIVDRTGYFLE